jgi:transcriptional regulator with XRE-family HTH domain
MMHSQVDEYKKGIGRRFGVFRQLVMKTQQEFADEASLPMEYINQIELGNILPGIISIEFFYSHYGLDLSWLVSGHGNIFNRRAPQTPIYAIQLDRLLDYRDPEFSRCLEQIKGNRIPDIIKEDIIALRKQGNPNYKQMNEYHEQATNQATNIIKLPEREV